MMEHALMSAVVLTVIMLLAALVVVWTRKRTWLRAVAIPGALLAASVSTFVLLESLGYAVPLIGGLTIPAGENPVLSAKFAVEQGIFVTIDLPAGPRLYWLPWSKATADSLQEMMENAQKGGSVTVTVMPFEFSWDQHAPQFNELPPPKWMPDKPPATPGPPHFDA